LEINEELAIKERLGSEEWPSFLRFTRNSTFSILLISALSSDRVRLVANVAVEESTSIQAAGCPREEFERAQI
jgi:hypothetical protein